VSRLTRLP